jgi:RNA polymerase sigma-70 factor (ECF subfamily)
MTEALQSQAEFRAAALACLDGLFGYAMSLSHNQTEAEDLVQDTYLRAVRAFEQLTPDSNLKGWLYVIARNTWKNRLRHAHSGPQFVEMHDDQHDDAIAQARSNDDPHAAYVAELERSSVRAAVEELPTLYREVIVLREFEELSYQEIAKILGCPPGTVMSRLARARDKLRVQLSAWSIRPPLEGETK